MYKMYIITHNSRHRFVLSLLKLKKEEELKNSKRRRKEIWGNVALFRFMFVNFCLNFFLPDFCVMYCASCAFVFLFVPLFVSVFVDWRRQRGKEEQKKRTQKSAVRKQNECNRCLSLFVFFYHVVALLLRVGGTWHGRRYKCSRQEGFHSAKSPSDTVSAGMYTAWPGWLGGASWPGGGGASGWVGLMEHPLLRHISPAASRITVEKNRTLINVML